MTERERELFFYIQMTEDQFSDCLSDAFLLCYCVSTASWLYVQGVVGLGKEKFLVHYEFVSMKCTFNEGNLYWKNLHESWIGIHFWTVIMWHNARKFDIDVPIHNGHYCSAVWLEDT